MPLPYVLSVGVDGVGSSVFSGGDSVGDGIDSAASSTIRRFVTLRLRCDRTPYSLDVRRGAYGEGGKGVLSPVVGASIVGGGGLSSSGGGLTIGTFLASGTRSDNCLRSLYVGTEVSMVTSWVCPGVVPVSFCQLPYETLPLMYVA